MGEHRSNPNIRALQMIGANGPAGQEHAWLYGDHSDYFLHLPDGKVVAEVTIKIPQSQKKEDVLYMVSFIDKNEAGKPPALPDFYATRSAAREAVELRYGERTVSQNMLTALQ